MRCACCRPGLRGAGWEPACVTRQTSCGTMWPCEPMVKRPGCAGGWYIVASRHAGEARSRVERFSRELQSASNEPGEPFEASNGSLRRLHVRVRFQVPPRRKPSRHGRRRSAGRPQKFPAAAWRGHRRRASRARACQTKKAMKPAGETHWVRGPAKSPSRMKEQHRINRLPRGDGFHGMFCMN